MIDKRVIGAFAGGLAVAAIGCVGYLKWPAPTFEECMIDGMRGQPQVMYGAVEKTCSRRTGRTENISYYSGSLDFYRDNDKVQVVGRSDIYDVTEGAFRVSVVKCEEAKDADFGTPVQASFVSPNHLAIPLTDDQEFTMSDGGMCFRADRLRGRYK